MKKLLAALIVITMVLLSGQAYTKDVLYKENASTILGESEDKVILNVPILKETDESGSITYSKDREGNLYGPTDYAIDGNSILILNTTKNSIMVYNDGKYSQTLSLEGFEFYGTRIASANGIHYVLGNNLTVLVLKPESKPFIVDISKIVIDEAIFEFQAINEYLYITDATSTTYKLCLREENFNLENKYSGYFVDNNTIQVKTTINYSNQDQTVTNYVIDLLDLSLNKNISINFKLENTGYAAKYLGMDPSGYYRVKIYEYLVNEDGSTQCNESIVLIDKTGTVIAQKILETPYMSILGQTKLVNGKIYHLNNTLEAFSINEINSFSNNIYLLEYSNTELNNDFTNTLSTNTSSISSNTNNNTLILFTLSSISRTQVITNAVSYHSGFSWTCTSANLATLSGWIKPGYISGAGTYSYMPYCWGKWDTPTQFQNGLASGGRVGNIGSTYLWNTYGCDCSGFVSRCWNLDQKYYTGSLPSLCTQINYTQLQKGDILNYNDTYLNDGDSSHVILFEKVDSSTGYYVCYEATTMNSYDRVSHTSRTSTSLSSAGYVALKYNNITG